MVRLCWTEWRNDRRYQLNTCGPSYVALGDGGNVEGVYRNFVDEVDKSTNKTFCERSHMHRFNNNTDSLPGYQSAPQPPACRTVSFERSYIDRNKVPGSTPMGLKSNTDLSGTQPYYWCVRPSGLRSPSTPVVSARWLASWLLPPACSPLSVREPKPLRRAMTHILRACLSP